jgi:hypothetical protein
MIQRLLLVRLIEHLHVNQRHLLPSAAQFYSCRFNNA